MTIEYDPSIIYSYYYTPSSILHSNGGPKDIDSLLCCYRRLEFADSVKEKSPRFYDKILPVQEWISKMLSFRRLSRYSIKDVSQLISRLRPEVFPFLKTMRWKGFPKVVINTPMIALIVISIAIPFAKQARHVFHRLISE